MAIMGIRAIGRQAWYFNSRFKILLLNMFVTVEEFHRYSDKSLSLLESAKDVSSTCPSMCHELHVTAGTPNSLHDGFARA